MNITYLYFVDKPIEWNVSQFSTFLAVKYGLNSFALMFIMPCFRKLPDSYLILIGIISRMTGYLFFAFSKTPQLIYTG